MDIRALREARGWTQAELAAQLGTDHVTVSRWERGVSIPRRSAQHRLAMLFSGPSGGDHRREPDVLYENLQRRRTTGDVLPMTRIDLQQILDRSIERAGPYLRESFQMPDHSLSAPQLERHLVGKNWTIALATVTSKNEPRVGPVGALFHDGCFNAPILKTAARVKHVLRNPAASVTLYDGNDFALIVHGRAQVLGLGDDGFDALVEWQRGLNDGRCVLDWGPHDQAAFLAVVPDLMFTFARYPERFAP